MQNAAPRKPVTLSPFFILDREKVFGDFRYATPEEYAQFWTGLIRRSGFDIIMLQDSGEHFSYVTNEQRRPFFAAMQSACMAAGAGLWGNVETAEFECPSIEEYVADTGVSTTPRSGMRRRAPCRWTGWKTNSAWPRNSRIASSAGAIASSGDRRLGRKQRLGTAIIGCITAGLRTWGDNRAVPRRPFSSWRGSARGAGVLTDARRRPSRCRGPIDGSQRGHQAAVA